MRGGRDGARDHHRTRREHPLSGPPADPRRIPVIVGVGQVNDRPADPADGLDPIGLMAAALARADADAGGGWLTAAQSLGVVDQISFRTLNPVVDTLAATLAIAPAHRSQTDGPMGDSPVRLLHEAANRVGAGEADVCLVVGGEALRTAAQHAAIAAGDRPSDHNAMTRRHDARAPSYRARHGLVAPVDVYPLYENAARAAWGQTLAEAQRETAAIWSRLADVAVATDAAWLRTPLAPAEIATPTADNRPIAFPYTKFMVANASVNQGAGFIVASLAAARARGIPDTRLVHIGAGAAAHESEDVLARDRYDRSAGMAVTLERTLAMNGLGVDDLAHVELYSCFPCVPKLARRVIGWPVDRPISVFGGLTFGGGPIGNYMSHAIAEMTHRLRGTMDRGLLFGNGGFATHNHAIVLGGTPVEGIRFPQDFDCQRLADARRDAAPPVDEDYVGGAAIETYTVLYDRTGAVRHGVVVALTPEGRRTLAIVPADDTAAIAFLTDGAVEPVGARGHIVATGDLRRLTLF